MLGRDKFLAKYADLFSGVVDTVRVTPPLHIMASSSWGTQVASKFLDLVVHGEQFKNKRKVVMIFFSNKGGVMLERLNSIARQAFHRSLMPT